MKILYIQYTNPACYPSLEHSSRLFAKNNWQVLFLGTGSFGVSNNLTFCQEKNVTLRKLPYCSNSPFQKVHYILFCLWVMLWVFRWRPEWVYASDPMSSPPALILNYFSSIRVIYHEHDLVGSKQNRFILLARKALAKRARLCILPNEERVRLFNADMDNKISAFSVWNCAMREEASLIYDKPKDKILRILYHGSIVPSRLPLTVLEAMRRLPEYVRLYIVGYETEGYTGYIKLLKKESERHCVHNRIDFVGSLPTRNELLRYCQRCNIGLALMPKNTSDINEKTMAGASNKPFDYLACGLVLLVSDLPDWKKTYVEPGYGLACNPEDSKSIAGALGWFLEHPTQMHKMGERGRERIKSEWNYERQFKPVIDYINGQKR